MPTEDTGSRSQRRRLTRLCRKQRMRSHPHSSPVVHATMCDVNSSPPIHDDVPHPNPRFTPHKVDPAFVECALWDKLGRLHLTALIDTGATFSIVSREHAKQITHGRPQQVQLANGSVTKVSKLTCRTVQLGDHIIEHIFYVMPNAPAPIILGLDFLDLHNIDIMTKQRYIQFVGDTDKIPLLQSGKSRVLAAAMAATKEYDNRLPTADNDYPDPKLGNAPLTSEQREIANDLLIRNKHCFSTRERPLGKVTFIELDLVEHHLKHDLQHCHLRNCKRSNNGYKKWLIWVLLDLLHRSGLHGLPLLLRRTAQPDFV